VCDLLSVTDGQCTVVDQNSILTAL